MSTGQFGYGGVPGCCVDPEYGYQILSSYFYVSQVSRQTYISKQCNLDAYARPTDERSLVRGGAGHNQGSFVYFAKACGGWVFADVNGVD